MIRAARRRSIGTGLTAGAGLSAAALGLGLGMSIGMGAAHADPDASDPAGLLSSAAADLTQAEDVLTGVDVPTSMQKFIDDQTQLPDHYLQLITQAESIQDPLFSSDNSFVSEVANLLYGNLDQQFAQDSAALLAAEQAFAADPSQATEAGVLTSDLQIAGTALDSLFPELAGVFIDRLLGIDVPLPDPASDLIPDLFS